MWKIECPNCHHLFSVVTEENKDLIDDEKAEDIKENSHERVEDALENLVPYSRRVPGIPSARRSMWTTLPTNTSSNANIAASNGPNSRRKSE